MNMSRPTAEQANPAGQWARLPDMNADRASLQSRLIVRLCAVFVAFFLAAGLVVFLIYHSDTAEIPFDVLAGDLSNLKLAISVDADGKLHVDPTKISPGTGYMAMDRG